MSQFAIAASSAAQFRRKQRRPVQGNPASDRLLRGPGCNRHSRICADASVRFTGLPRRFHSDGPSGCVFGGMAESIGPMWSKSKPKPNPGSGPAASRWSAPSPGKRTRREDHALLIVRDEFRPAIPRSGWSPPEPVSASPTRPAYSDCPAGGNKLSSNGKQCLNCLCQLRGQAHTLAITQMRNWLLRLCVH
jgi:hypothetical protein